ncbi:MULTISPECIES: DMT family transporter [Halomonas]|uniref:DMT family transporter n=1 Tax=Halomonas colorata TaxID=2742615 RepID=A0ABR9FWD0_9GAMM|nr:MULTISPECIES: DMT family transporter [Halomonas]MBE0462961.1 DMT family transporter [Halomonas colorata]HCR98722.1 EamA family transporter [Halomonas sp.]
MQRTHSPIVFPRWYSVGAALVAVILWSVAPLLAERAHTSSPLQLTALTLLAGAFATLPLSRRVNVTSCSLNWQLGIWVGIPLLILGAVSTYFIGMRLAPAAEAALITYTWPVLFVLLSQWSRFGRIRLAGIIGALIAFSGAAILLIPQAISNGLGGATLGYGLALLAACCWALYSWLSQAAPVSITPLLPRMLLIACAIATIASIGMEGQLVLPSSEALLAGVALGLGPYGVAMVAWDKALRWGHASLVGSLAYGVPILAGFLLVLAGVSVLDWRLPTAALLVVIGCLNAGR